MLSITRTKATSPALERIRNRKIAERMVTKTTVRQGYLERPKNIYIMDETIEMPIIREAMPKKHAAPRTITCMTCENRGICPQFDNPFKPDELAIIRRNKEGGELWQKVELNKGSVYFDVAMEGDWIHKDHLADAVSLPKHLTADHYGSFYESPGYIEMMQSQIGMRPYKLQATQALVWALSRQDGQLYVFRLKDLSHQGSMRRYAHRNKEGRWQGPQTPIHLPYVPNEIYAYQALPSGPYSRVIRGKDGHLIHTPTGRPSYDAKSHQWVKIGQMSEEQALYKIGSGPRVQPGKLQTVPYLERDTVEDWEEHDLSPYEIPEADYNGPMIEA
jgi:hypothetical protein